MNYWLYVIWMSSIMISDWIVLMIGVPNSWPKIKTPVIWDTIVLIMSSLLWRWSPDHLITIMRISLSGKIIFILKQDPVYRYVILIDVNKSIFMSISSLCQTISCILIFCSVPRCRIWVQPWRCGCLVTWFCYQVIAKPGNKTATPSWPDPYTYKLYPTSFHHLLFGRAQPLLN